MGTPVLNESTNFGTESFCLPRKRVHRKKCGYHQKSTQEEVWITPVSKDKKEVSSIYKCMNRNTHKTQTERKEASEHWR
jgi:hypothetical protein